MKYCANQARIYLGFNQHTINMRWPARILYAIELLESTIVTIVAPKNKNDHMTQGIVHLGNTKPAKIHIL